jgi:APA family basic amino acid/polyamine antiporter
VLFCLLSLVLVETPQVVHVLPQSGDVELLTSGAFAVSLIYVSYAYSGWNAATYLSSEIDNPQRNLPKVLAVGTLIVMILYFALNYAFLHAAPMDAMSGELEVGYIAAGFMCGAQGAMIMGTALAILLMSTVSAMIMAGPRVLQVIGEDFPAFRLLGRTNKNGIPHVAILVQASIALLFVFTSTFESILIFSGFMLALNTLATALGLFVLRWRQPDLPRPYRTWGYPVTPLVFIALTSWTSVFVLVQKPREAMFGLLLIGAGLVCYFLTRPTGRDGD